MKKLALVLNALLVAVTTLMFLAHGPPGDEEMLLVLLMLAAPAISLYAFRSHLLGSEEENAFPEERVAAAPEPRNIVAGQNRKPLYEWIDSVEERLDAVETERTEQ